MTTSQPLWRRRVRPFRLLIALLLPATAPQLAAAQAPLAPAGVYRTAAQYRQRRPAPPATDVRNSDKRGALVVVAQRGPAQTKTFVPRDSAWGYVDGNGRAYRLVRGEDYRIEQADTLTIYSSNATSAAAGSRTYTARQYFFSRGLTGLVFPLTDKLLRQAFEASSPAFVAALRERPATQDLSAYNKATGQFRVVELFRQSLGK